MSEPQIQPQSQAPSQPQSQPQDGPQNQPQSQPQSPPQSQPQDRPPNQPQSQPQSPPQDRPPEGTTTDDDDETSYIDVGDREQEDKTADTKEGEMETKEYGWRVLLLIQFEVQFQTLVLICCFVSVAPTITYLVFYLANAYTPNDYFTVDVVLLYLLDIIYLLDALSMTIYKNIRWDDVKYLHKSRSSLALFIDFISLLPFDGLYMFISGERPYLLTIYILRLRYALRVHRIFGKLKEIENDVGINAIHGAHIQFGCSLILLIIVAVNIQYLLFCYGQDCNVTNEFVEHLYRATGKILLRGCSAPETVSLPTFCFFSFVNMCAFFYIKCYVVAKFISVIKQNIRVWAYYSNRLAEIFSFYSNVFKADNLLKSACANYYGLFWKYRQGIDQPTSGVIPLITVTEIKLDLAWKAFQHSHLFRKEEVHFLHFLAMFVEHRFMIPGEVVYQRSKVKEKMVYIVSGNIQIYSEEDGETPILSFSSGTCLGETSLILAYQSSCTVVCLDYCEFCVLERKHFLKIKTKYPETYTRLRDRVYNRCQKAREYVEVSEYERYKNAIVEKARVLSIKRLKLTLRKLLSKNPNYMQNYLKELELDERLWFEKVNKLVFCPYYLDMLALTDESLLVRDSVFIRMKFPYILVPNSVIIKYWDRLVAIVLLVLIFAYPYFTWFLKEESGIFTAFMYCVTIVWILDVYIEVTTAVQSGTKLATTVTDITLIKSGSLNFFLDILAAVPFELIARLISGKVTYEYRRYLQINRLLKLPSIEIIFKTYKDSITHDLVWIRCIKYTTYFTFIIYWVAAMHYFLLQIEESEDSYYHNFLYKEIGAKTPVQHLLCFIYLATRIITGLALYLMATGEAHIFYMPLTITMIFVTVFYVIFIADLSSAETLKARGKLKVQEQLNSLKFVMEGLDPEFVECILTYFDHQWAANRGQTIIYTDGLTFDMPKEMFLILQYNYLQATMVKIPLFQEIQKPLLMRICACVKILDIPPGQIMTYAGEVSSEMYIIDAGYCNQISADHQIMTVIGPGDSFALVECCMRVPVTNSVITRTSCRFFALNFELFTEALSSYPERVLELQEIVDQCMLTVRFEETSHMHDEDMLKKKKKEKTRSVVNFGYRLPPNSDESRNYHKVFDSLGYWGFVRYILLRHTFTPYGRFMHWWEIFRCIFAFFSGILFSLPVLHSSIVTVSIGAFLDMMSLIDIYIRHHVCYFNEIGIEITHPLKTATNYWKHAFVIDFIASFPVDIIYLACTGTIVPPDLRIYTGLNRVLQSYRIWAAFQVKLSEVRSKSRLLVPLKWLPFFFILTVYMGNFILRISCTFNSKVSATPLFENGVRCDDHSWLADSNFRKPLSPERVFTYGVYFVSTITTGVGLQGFSVKTVTEVGIVTGLALVGFFAFEFITATIIGINLSRNTDLMKYQHDMSALMRFFMYKRIDQKIKDEIVEHFEYEFRKKRGKQYLVIMSCFNNALKEDLLFNLFGQTLAKSVIFESANISFFRSLLLVARHEIIIRRGIISRVNDVQGIMYFILKGQVEVLGPDYAHLLVLPVGSLFGNLDDVQFGRRTLTMVAKGHVELLKIRTVDFYSILNQYIRLLTYFRKLTCVHTDYLIGGKLVETDPAKVPPVHKKHSSKLKFVATYTMSQD